MLPGLEAAELPADAIEVGRILDAWGIKGWFKVFPYSADPEAREHLAWYGEQRWNRTKLGELLDQAGLWAARNEVPIWCNEFGAVRDAVLALRERLGMVPPGPPGRGL